MISDTFTRFILISGLVLFLASSCVAIVVWSTLALIDAVVRWGATAWGPPRERDAASELLRERAGTVATESDPTSGGAA